jgi:segregation and condensation protein B
MENISNINIEQVKAPFLNLSRQEQKSVVEVLLFSSNEPLSLRNIYDFFVLKYNKEPRRQKARNNVEYASDETIEVVEPEQQELYDPYKENGELFDDIFSGIIDEINQELFETGRPFQIVNVAGGYQYASRPEYGELLNQMIKSKTRKRLSQAALEALAIIAYKQPVSKPEIEQIRGVNSNEIVNSLIEKKLVKIVGRKDVLGKPLLFGTTEDFLKTFGLDSLSDMPNLRELEDISLESMTDHPSVELQIEMENEETKELQTEIDQSFPPESLS